MKKLLIIPMLAMTLIGSSFAGDRDDSMSFENTTFDQDMLAGTAAVVETFGLFYLNHSMNLDSKELNAIAKKMKPDQRIPRAVRKKIKILQGKQLLGFLVLGDLGWKAKKALWDGENPGISPMVSTMVDAARDTFEKSEVDNNKYISGSEQVVTE